MIPGVVASSRPASYRPPDVVAYSDTEFSTVSSQTRTIPIEAEAGDLLVACVMARSAVTAPEGWGLAKSSEYPTDSFTQYTQIYTKEAEEGDAGSSATFLQSESARMATHIIVVRHDLPLSVVDAEAISDGVSGGHSPIAEIAASGSRQLAVTACSWVFAATSAPNTAEVSAGWEQTTPRTSNDKANQIRMGVAYRAVRPPQVTSGVFIVNNSSTPGSCGVTILVEAAEP